MFKYLYTLRFCKKGTKATPIFHLLLYYRSRFISNLGCIDLGKHKSIVYFDKVLYYYFAGFRIRKYYRFLDVFNILFIGHGRLGSDSSLFQSLSVSTKPMFLTPRSYFTPKRHRLLKKFK